MSLSSKSRVIAFMIALATAAMLFAVVFAGQARAGTQGSQTLTVDDDKQECPSADFESIQAAVDAADPGDEIEVCAGTYEEQVSIVDKDDITLFSQEPREAEINAPDDDLDEPGDLVTIDGSEGVALEDFTISGPLPNSEFCSEQLRSGVRVIGGASATIAGNHITEIRSESDDLRGCQNGFAIAVGRGSVGETGTATIRDNLIDKYQKGGVYADGEGTEVRIRNNDIFGVGPTDDIGQNGIQVSRDATGDIRKNLVRDNIYTGIPNTPGAEPGQASGVILFSLNDDLLVTQNMVRDNDTNIALYEALRLDVTRNQTRNATFFDGIFADADSERNRFELNRSIGNEDQDCRDDSDGNRTAGTANLWRGNIGDKDMPNGICRRG